MGSAVSAAVLLDTATSPEGLPSGTCLQISERQKKIRLGAGFLLFDNQPIRLYKYISAVRCQITGSGRTFKRRFAMNRKLDFTKFAAVLLLGRVMDENLYLNSYIESVTEYIKNQQKKDILQVLEDLRETSAILKLLVISCIKSDKYDKEIYTLVEKTGYDHYVCQIACCSGKLPVPGIMKLLLQLTDHEAVIYIVKKTVEVGAVKDGDIVALLHSFGTPQLRDDALITFCAEKLINYIDSE